MIPAARSGVVEADVLGITSTPAAITDGESGPESEIIDAEVVEDEQ